MKFLFLSLLITAFLLSCKSNSSGNAANKSLNYEDALKKTQKQILESDSLVFIFPINKMVTDKPVHKTIINKTEIEKFGKLFIQNARSDSCKSIGYEASLLVYQGKRQDSINYSLDTNCPIFQFTIGNKTFTSKMSYQCGMFLDNFVQTENNKMFDKK